MAHFLFSAFADEASGSVKEQIVACKKNNIEFIELRNCDGKNISDFTVDEAKELKKILDEGGMKVSSIGSHYGKIEITDDFGPHFEAFKNTVEVAKILEAKYIRMFSFYFTKGESFEEYRDEVFARLNAMADYANERGILCCHENERGIYGDIPSRCLEIAEHFGDRLGCIFDPANYILNGSDTKSGFDSLFPYITYMHIKDGLYKEGIVVPAGEGDGNLPYILKKLDEKEGVFFLSVEPHLRTFDGLKDLEVNEQLALKMNSKYIYDNNEASFAAACCAAHKVVEEEVQPVRLGIIGCGNMGSSHIHDHALGRHHEIRITACADIIPERAEKMKEHLPFIKTFDSAEALIDSGEVDAVLIATPHYSHPVIAKYAFSKGLHVLTEKPAGVYTKQVREMNEAAAASGKVFGIMYNQRTNCVYRKVRELVQSGELGEMKRVSWIITDWYRTQAYYNSGGWRATWAGEGGGVLLNQCPHNLDLWQWICGMPCKIRAVCHEGKWHDIEVEDDVSIYAEYPNGATGTFVTTTGDCPGTNRLEITLDGGKIIVDDGLKISLYRLKGLTSKHCADSESGFGKLEGEWEEVETDGRNAQHREVVSKFAAAILRGEPLVAKGEEGINGLTISNAAHLSSWLGKDILLPIDEDLYYSELQKKIASGKAEKETVTGSVQGDMSSTF
ncbi:MAG: TIM barrel protein [Clostridia bacterium]|nr:TIM barrel protein [Clostridia bacterium]